MAAQRQADSSQLLPFQRRIVASLIPPPDAHHSTGNLLLILARGLGMRSIIATLLKIYDTPDQLVLVLNATAEEEKGLSEEVGMKLKVVGFETPVSVRTDLYKSGGLLSVTSRILIVDMLMKKIPVDLVSGIFVLHAESVTPTSQETFVVRIYRQMNKTGFLKAFSDQPESFTFGLSPLQTVLTQLKIREVAIWPRFHQDVQNDLMRRKSDVVELHQHLSAPMQEVHAAIIECMEATLSEIKRSNTSLEVEDLTVENALFRSFDSLVRKKLDPVWDRVGPKTKMLVSDLSVLRNLQNYLLALDCVSFNRYLETILSSQNTGPKGAPRQNRSPWLFTPAADTIFSVSKARVYIQKPIPKPITAGDKDKGKSKALPAEPEGEIELDDWGPTAEEVEGLRAIEEQEEEERRREIEVKKKEVQINAEKRPEDEVGLAEALKAIEEMEERETNAKMRREEKAEKERLDWLPPGVEPVLEEQPKWKLLAEVLEEIESDLFFAPVNPHNVSTDTILVMCASSETCSTIREYLSSRTDKDGGQAMMRAKLSRYFYWKAAMGKMQRNLKNQDGGWKNKNGTTGKGKAAAAPNLFESAAMKRKTDYQRGQVPNSKRRRVRGGGAVGPANSTHADQTKLFTSKVGASADALEVEAGAVADIMDASTVASNASSSMHPEPSVDVDVFSELDFADWFGLLANEDLVIVRPYMDDDDDRMLEELRPKYIVMFDPSTSFVRRVEAYRAAHAGLAVRVYLLLYKNSVEEQRFLSSMRKEKDAFEKLIREKGVMAIPHEAEYRPGEETAGALRTISSRIGGKQARTDQPRVIVDVREFRSALPSLLHAAGFDVVPITITIGDYIITPEMSIERKSLPDLISSFSSGRLYQQCELMTAHYKQPILLIEFDEKKSFNIEAYTDPRGKGVEQTPSSDTDLRSKLVLLTLTFPRLRIIWSSSPYQTVEIFRDLKENRDEPDAGKAVKVGADETSGGVAAEGTGEAGFSMTPQEVLRNLPGITTKNYRFVMSKVENIEALCQLDLKGVQELIGVEAGRTLHAFLGRDVRADWTD